jgi:hypothetical protein
MEYEVVFDAARIAAKWAEVNWAITGLGISILLVALLRQVKLRGPQSGRWIVVLLFMWIGVQFMFTRYYFPSSLRKPWFRTGRLVTVEGKAENFHSVNTGNVSVDTYMVEGRRVSYANQEPTCCYHMPAGFGGPVREGMQVRVTMDGPCVVKLEIAKGQ